MLEFVTSRKGLWLVFAGFLLGIASLVIPPLIYRVAPREWKPGGVERAILVDSEFEELWDMTAYIGCKTCLISTENNVYFSGSLKNNSREFLVVLDLFTGEIEWQQVLQRGQTLQGLDSQHIYVNQPSTQKIANATQMWGGGKLIAYNIKSHDEVWNQKFAGSGGTSIISIVDDVLEVDAGPGFYQVDSHTGRQISGPQQQALLFNGEGVQYKQYAGSELSGINMETMMPIWTYKLPRFSQFIFEDEFILIGNGGATALNGNTGEVLWTQRDVISNIAVSNGIAYFIQMENGIWGGHNTLDAQLFAVDVQTGETLSTLHFEPSKIRSGYEYLVAASDDIVLMYLGDSSQLTALRFSPDE